MTTLIKIGLIIIPFYEVVARCFPNTLIIAGDTRGPKLMLSLMIALGLWFLALSQGTIKAFKSKGILAFAAYALVCVQFAPNIPLFINDINSTLFWMWKQIFILFSFLLLIMTVSSIDFEGKDVRKIIDVMAICGTVMSAYIFIQAFGLDEFYFTKKGQMFSSVTNPHLVGVLGQPTVVASFLAIIFPLAASVRRPVCSLLIFICLVLINSKIALVSGSIGLLAYALLSRKKALSAIIISILLVTSLFFIMDKNRSVSWHDNGRVAQWEQILKFWKTPLDVNGEKRVFTITGFGPGSYEYLYPLQAKSRFFHPHNEYIYILFNFGIIGIGIVLYSIYEFFVNIKRLAVFKDDLRCGMMASLITALLCAGGTFILGLGAHSFYLAVLVGILLNTNYLQGGRNVP